MTARLGRDIRDLVTTATSEARLRNDPRLAPEHLLLALLHDPVLSADYLRQHTARGGRDALAALDIAALETAGIDPADCPPSRAVPHAPEKLELTAAARRVLERSARIAKGHRLRRVQPRHLLTAILGETGPSTAHDVLRSLDLDPAEMMSRLHAA